MPLFRSAALIKSEKLAILDELTKFLLGKTELPESEKTENQLAANSGAATQQIEPSGNTLTKLRIEL